MKSPKYHSENVTIQAVTEKILLVVGGTLVFHYVVSDICLHYRLSPIN